MCLVRLSQIGSWLLGLSELLAGLVYMILAWIIADSPNRFRAQTTPTPLQSQTFTIVAAVGVLALLTDLWRAQCWLVPSGKPIRFGAQQG